MMESLLSLNGVLKNITILSNRNFFRPTDQVSVLSIAPSSKGI